MKWNKIGLVFVIFIITITISSSSIVQSFAEELILSIPTYDGLLIDNGDNDICDGNADLIKSDDSQTLDITVYATGGTADCKRSFVEWSIVNLPINAQILDTVFKFQVSKEGTRTCDIFSMTDYRPSVSSAADIWTSMGSGTNYVDGGSFCTTEASNVIVDLGTSADSDLQTALGAGISYFAIGITTDDESMGGTNHYHELVSKEGPGNPDPTLIITYTLEAVLPPTNLSATAISDLQIDLSWTAPSGTVTGYKIEREFPVNAGFTELFTTTGTSTTYSDTGLNANSTYNYRVSTINSSETSGPSNVASVTTQSTPTTPPPTNSTIVDLQNQINALNQTLNTLQSQVQLNSDQIDHQYQIWDIIRDAIINWLTSKPT